MEIPDPNNPGQVFCCHEPLAFKDLKQLKEAASQYSTQAPFTLSLMESFQALNLTPNDWQQLCCTVLSGGDFLIWRGEFQDGCIQTAAQNVLHGQLQRNADKLAGMGALGTIQQQIQYNLAVYAQVATAAIGAWRALPLIDVGDHLSKILHGLSEPFSDFVD